jgi:hypothetical protein
MNELGSLLDIFEAFPAAQVADRMEVSSDYTVTNDMVKNIFYHYKTGVENDIIPWFDASEYGFINTPQAAYVSKMTNFDQQLIDLFFLNLHIMVNDGEIKPVFIQIKRPEAHPVEEVKTALKTGVKTGFEMQKSILNRILWVMGGVVVIMVGIKAAPVIYQSIKKKRSK